MLDEIRKNSSDASYSMYCAFMTILMFEHLNATCMARMRSLCEHVLVFPRMFWPLVLHFSLLFPFFCIFSLFSFRSRVCFFSELPFFVLWFLVSSSCYFFFSDSSMVDYSVVRVNCPSIAFFFAHLCSLLESIEGECLERISFFVGEDCPYTSVLSSLFPMVSHSARAARLLKMSEVRSSDLETGLSTSDDHVVSEATSVSTPYKAWNISCSLMRKDEQQIGDRFQFPDSVKIRISSDEEKACHSFADEVCFYKDDFVSGLRFPVHPFVRELFSYLHLTSAQLVPNSWRILVSCMVVWMSINNDDVIRGDKFLHFYRLRKSKDHGYYEFKSWDRASRLILDYPTSLRNWKPNFFFIFESSWEFVLGEDLDETPKFFRS